MKILYLAPLIMTLTFFSILPASTPSSKDFQLQQINQEISDLEKQLSENRKKALNLEMKAQPYMFDNWHEFAEDIHEEEEYEKKILHLKTKLEVLYSQKNTLLNQSSTE